MVRELTSHKANGLNDALRIDVLGEVGPGGASHCYSIVYVADLVPHCQDIRFQNGPTQEAGINGISNEALLAIVEDRLLGFQSGEFACELNGRALSFVRAALDALKLRTEGRIARGIEGTNQT